jgi:hypothetical protein
MSIKIVNNTKAEASFKVEDVFFNKGAYSNAVPVGQEIFNITSHDGRSTYSFNHLFNDSNLYIQVYEEKAGGIYEIVYPAITVTTTVIDLSFSTFNLGANYKIVLLG